MIKCEWIATLKIFQKIYSFEGKAKLNLIFTFDQSLNTFRVKCHYLSILSCVIFFMVQGKRHSYKAGVLFSMVKENTTLLYCIIFYSKFSREMQHGYIVYCYIIYCTGLYKTVILYIVLYLYSILYRAIQHHYI